MTAPLPTLPPRTAATVSHVDWAALTDSEGRRLREFGLDEGVEIELLHRGGLGGGPLACRLGRMMVTFRGHVARAIHVAV